MTWVGRQSNRPCGAVAAGLLVVAEMTATAGAGAIDRANGQPMVVAQAGSTGGTIGKTDKSASGSTGEPRVIRREPRRSRQSAPASPCGKVPGVWSWFNGSVVTIAAGGSASGGALTARWTCASGKVVMHWSHGYVDRLTLSADGNNLSGSNGLIRVWGQRR
jgi:hypothetical protein